MSKDFPTNALDCIPDTFFETVPKCQGSYKGICAGYADLKAENQRLMDSVNVHIAEYRSERERADVLQEENQRLREAALNLIYQLNSMLTFYGMDEQKGEVSEVIHNHARASIERAEEAMK